MHMKKLCKAENDSHIKMKDNYWWIMLMGLVITLLGLITNKFLFLLLIFPLSSFLSKTN
jgi:hypothetical protein